MADRDKDSPEPKPDAPPRSKPGESSKPGPASPQRDKPVPDMTVEETLALIREHPLYKNVIHDKSNDDQFLSSGFHSRHINGQYIAAGKLTNEVLQSMQIKEPITRTLILGIVTDILQCRGEWPPVCIVHPHPKQHSKVFNDPIHGHIKMEHPLVKIIDTLEFQRLKHIKQLGCTYDVFPGASHNCFEHSLGVCHVAGEMMRMLQTECCDQFQISCKDVLCVKIAGLCHNLGRGPFAKVFDDLCRNELGVSGWSFEKASVVMFEQLMKNNFELRTILREYDIEERDIDRIKAMIKGDHHSCAAAEQDHNRFLYSIVVNKKTLIDAETMDSIARDSYYVGVPTSSDYKRLVKFLRVNTFGDERVFCFCDKEARDLYETLLSRLNLSQRAYQHKTVRVIEHLLKEALKLAEPFLQLKKIVEDLIGSESDKALAAAKFRSVTDTITECIENPCCCIEELLTIRSELMPGTPVPSGYQCPCAQTLGKKAHEILDGLKKSQELMNKIHRRELYKLVGKVIDREAKTHEVDSEKENIERFLVKENIHKDDIFIDVVLFQFGTAEEDNPIEDVLMYSKAAKNKLFPVKRDAVSSLLPQNFAELVYMVYSKKRENLQILISRFAEYSENVKGLVCYPSAYHTTSPPAAAHGSASRD